MTLGWPKSNSGHGTEEKNINSYSNNQACQSNLELSQVLAVFRSLTFTVIALLKAVNKLYRKVEQLKYSQNLELGI